MSDLTEHFKTCDCHDSWDQCPCAEGGHPLDRDCGCCPLGTGLCGALPSVAQRRDALLAKFEALVEESCHHCGRLPDADGDHTCLCPKADGVCFDHLAYPVVSLNALRDVISEARP